MSDLITDHPFKFEPLPIPSPVEPKQLVQKEISHMERKRGWFDTEDLPGIRTALGEENAQIIESILSNGGTVAELGAGRLNAIRELALRYPQGNLIAVEPFLDAIDLLTLPSNIRVVRSYVEDVNATNISPETLDAVFSAFVFDYPDDKLAFLQKAYSFLKPEGQAFIHSIGNPIYPGLNEIFDRTMNTKLLTFSKEENGGKVFTLTKKATGNLNFGNYTFTTISIGGAQTTTMYEFE